MDIPDVDVFAARSHMLMNRIRCNWKKTQIIIYSHSTISPSRRSIKQVNLLTTANFGQTVVLQKYGIQVEIAMDDGRLRAV